MMQQRSSGVVLLLRPLVGSSERFREGSSRPWSGSCVIAEACMPEKARTATGLETPPVDPSPDAEPQAAMPCIGNGKKPPMAACCG